MFISTFQPTRSREDVDRKGPGRTRRGSALCRSTVRGFFSSGSLKRLFDLGILCSALCSFSQDTWGPHLEILEAARKV